jgi:Na+/proline symporter
MLSAKDEKNAIGATLFFNIAHYALRPWPWIIVALASLVVFPTVNDLQLAFPHIPADKLGDDLAYPAMLTFLPTGMIGVVLASLIAAVMSTLSTHLNWGSSYIVNDFYMRFLKPEASDKELVAVGRISTVVLMVLSSFLALALSSALSAFEILLQIGAGTGLIFILRWFWWRINAYTEISAMIISFAVAIFFEVINPWLGWVDIPAEQSYLKLVYSVSITTVGWLLVTFLTQPEKDEVLLSFYRKVQPASLGWKKVLDRYPAEKQEKGRLGMEIGLMLVGTVMVYAALFSTGFFIYGEIVQGVIAGVVAVVGALFILLSWKKLNS